MAREPNGVKPCAISPCDRKRQNCSKLMSASGTATMIAKARHSATFLFSYSFGSAGASRSISYDRRPSGAYGTTPTSFFGKQELDFVESKEPLQLRGQSR